MHHLYVLPLPYPKFQRKEIVCKAGTLFFFLSAATLVFLSAAKRTYHLIALLWWPAGLMFVDSME